MIERLAFERVGEVTLDQVIALIRAAIERDYDLWSGMENLDALLSAVSSATSFREFVSLFGDSSR